MSAASRLAKADTRIQRALPPKDPKTGKFQKRPDPSELGPQLGKNRAGIPGGLGFDLPAPVVAGGLRWTADDGRPSASPIGAALAAELAVAST